MHVRLFSGLYVTLKVTNIHIFQSANVSNKTEVLLITKVRTLELGDAYRNQCEIYKSYKAYMLSLNITRSP